MTKAFIVVGHSNWGKSATLKALTGGKIQIRYFHIAERKIFVRRMSNDDFSEKFREFCETLDPIERNYLLATLCPDFDDPRKHTAVSLEILKRKYRLHFFVLRYKFDKRAQITEKEITKLSHYGSVFSYEKKSEPMERANALREYIKANIG